MVQKARGFEKSSWLWYLGFLLRIVTLGFFFFRRRSLVLRLMRSALSCLTSLFLSVLLAGLVFWWLLQLA